MKILYSEKYPLYPIKVSDGFVFVESLNNFKLNKILDSLGFVNNKLNIETFKLKILLIQKTLNIPQDQIDEIFSNKLEIPLSKHEMLDSCIQNLKIKPFAYQKDGINFALHNNYSLIGSQMGLGKTIQALGIATLYKKTIVICPASLKQNWQNEINKFTNLTSFVIKKVKDIEKINQPYDIIILNYDIISKCYNIFKDCELIICDEFHKVANPKSNMSKALWNVIQLNKPNRFIGLSGTAINNRVGEFFNLLRILSQSPSNCGIKLHEDKRYNIEFRFQQFFSYEKSNGYGSQFFGLRNYTELKKLLEHKYIRHTVEQHLPEMPDIIRQQIECKATLDSEDEQNLWEAYEKSSKGLQLDEHLSTVKRKNAESKINATYEHVKEILETEEKVIIFSDHVKPINELYDLLKEFKPVKITGEIATNKRQEEIDKFQFGESRVFLGTIGAASVGFTLTSSNIIVVNDFTWVPALLLQAEARARRIGQKKTVIANYMVASKIDKIILNSLISKTKLLNTVLSDGKESLFKVDKVT
jgi:SNF2 family DNA or RNA helicase